MVPVSLRSGARAKVYHGWWMVLAGLGILFYVTGTYFYGFSAFFNPILQDFGWSRTVTSAAFSVQRVTMGVMAPFVGRLVDRFGPRYLVLTGVFLVGVGYLLVAATQNLLMFYGAFFTVALGLSAGSFLVVNVSVGNWFSRQRGKALGIVAFGGGLGGLLVPVIAWLIGVLDWRWALVALALGVWAMGIPCALVMRRRPEDYGLLMDGVQPGKGPSGKPSPKQVEPSYPMRQILHFSAFWFFTLGMATEQLMTSAIFVHQIPAMVSVGFSPQKAALMVTLGTTLSLPGRWVGGTLADRVDKRLVLTASYLMQGLGGLLLAGIHTTWHAVAFAAVFGVGFGLGEPTRTATIADYFGRRSLGAVAGTMGFITMSAGLAGPIVAGWMADRFHDYRLAFVVLSLVALTSVPWFLAMRRPPGSQGQTR
ncbi:MAG: MFS transporter [Chloroflexi bacterium]|nr:MFS transporter [Chloroflexota bacterium]